MLGEQQQTQSQQSHPLAPRRLGLVFKVFKMTRSEDSSSYESAPFHETFTPPIYSLQPACRAEVGIIAGWMKDPLLAPTPPVESRCGDSELLATTDLAVHVCSSARVSAGTHSSLPRGDGRADCSDGCGDVASSGAEDERLLPAHVASRAYPQKHKHTHK